MRANAQGEVEGRVCRVMVCGCRGQTLSVMCDRAVGDEAGECVHEGHREGLCADQEQN